MFTSKKRKNWQNRSSNSINLKLRKIALHILIYYPRNLKTGYHHIREIGAESGNHQIIDLLDFNLRYEMILLIRSVTQCNVLTHSFPFKIYLNLGKLVENRQTASTESVKFGILGQWRSGKHGRFLART